MKIARTSDGIGVHLAAIGGDRDDRDQSQQEPESLIEHLADDLNGRSSAAYCNYLHKLKTDPLCLGSEIKMSRGEFTSANLEAFREAERLYGKHLAFSEAVRLLKAECAEEPTLTLAEIEEEIEFVQSEIRVPGDNWIEPDTVRKAFTRVLARLEAIKDELKRGTRGE